MPLQEGGRHNSTAYCRGASILPLHRSLRKPLLYESSEKPHGKVPVLFSLSEINVYQMQMQPENKAKAKGPENGLVLLQLQ